MKMKYLIGIGCMLISLSSCFKDDSVVGTNEFSEITVSAARDTITVNFGEELILDHLKVEQSGRELPLTYEWGYGNLDMSNGVPKPYPIKDSLHIISHDPEVKYAFRELGTFCLRLKIDNGESISFKYFILNVDTEFSEGITVLSRDEQGKGRLSFMKTLSTEELNAGKIPAFRTDIMQVSNPDLELEDVVDMFQSKGRLMVASGSMGRIYNMDSRTFDVDSKTSFIGIFPSVDFKAFAGITSLSNMYMFSGDGIGYVYECDLDELLLTEYIKDIRVNGILKGGKPTYVDYGSSILYVPKSGGVTTSLTKYVKYDIIAGTYISSKLYLIATYKDNPLHVYLASTTATLGTPTLIKDYTSSTPLKIDRNSLMVGSNATKCLYYTYDNEIYRWDPTRELPTASIIPVPSNMEITSLSMDPAEKLIYVGLYPKSGDKTLKGCLYIYDADTYKLINAYDNIADKPISIIYKKRV